VQNTVIHKKIRPFLLEAPGSGLAITYFAEQDRGSSMSLLGLFTKEEFLKKSTSVNGEIKKKKGK
jgi:hypothetical protein